MTERTLTYVRAIDLPEAMDNPKAHDDEGIDASLDRFGFTEPVLIDERTGRLVAGHGRRSAIIRRAQRDPELVPDGVLVDDEGQWLVPVVRGWASADDDEAAAYLVASNQLTNAGGWAREALSRVMARVERTPLGLSGIGFDQTAVDRILGRNPAPGSTDEQHIDERYEVVIECRDEEQQRELLEQMTKEGLTCRAIVV